jgi:hypothetical protein
MRVEMQHGDLSVVTRQRPQNRQRDGVVTSDRQHGRPVPSQVGDRRIDGGDRVVDVERIDSDVAGVDDLLIGEGLAPKAGLNGRNNFDAARTCPGPNRAPGR